MAASSRSLGRCLTTLKSRSVVTPLSSVQYLSTGSLKQQQQGSSRAPRTPITDDATKIAVKDGLLVAETRETRVVPKKVIGSSKRYSNRRSAKKSNSRSSAGVKSTGSEVPVLIPGGAAESNSQRDLSSLSRTSPFYHARSHRFGGGGSYQMTQIFPTVNFSALLNPKDYIKKSATPGGVVTISGADAARRLLRGRQELMDVMRKELLGRPKRKRNPPRPYSLIGHGVPKQLLQDHINMADSLLAFHNNAAECSFTNFHGDLSFNWVRIRSRKGENKASQWPPPAAASQHPEWETQMELYMTVMNRLASNLGIVLRKEAPPLMTVTVDDDEDDDFVTCVDSRAANTPRYWSVELLRGMAYPPHLLPKHADPLSPIIEWTPRDGISAPGHVCIRIQGTPTNSATGSLRRKKKIPVTLVFDACFRNSMAMR